MQFKSLILKTQYQKHVFSSKYGHNFHVLLREEQTPIQPLFCRLFRLEVFYFLYNPMQKCY